MVLENNHNLTTHLTTEQPLPDSSSCPQQGMMPCHIAKASQEGLEEQNKEPKAL